MRATVVPFIVVSLIHAASAQQPHQATGVRVGEVSSDSAIVCTRLTAKPTRKTDGFVCKGKPEEGVPPAVSVDDLHGACPGASGRVRLRYGLDQNLADAKATPWVHVKAETDFTRQFRIGSLQPAKVYFYAVETAGPGGEPKHGMLQGQFETAPPADKHAEVTFTVITGQMYRDLDHPEGFHIYKAMAKLKPKFIVPTGDTVYYDSDPPRATTPALARYHWHRIYSLPRLVDFHLKVPGYWEKDDHDTVDNDCWPTVKADRMLPMTFERGQQVFREQVPMGDRTYRTYRWGKGLQVWLVEGRDFRSSNKMKDGPDKTIWGAEQKHWLTKTLLESDADWKVLISPTPIVGPDRKNKADNHANAAFAHEGNWFRQWVKENLPENFFIACGDRHWQYHSIDPATGVHEFSCGPASDQHAGGSPGQDPECHKFHRVKGGFLSVSVFRTGDNKGITFRHHDVHGTVVNPYTRTTSLL